MAVAPISATGTWVLPVLVLLHARHLRASHRRQGTAGVCLRLSVYPGGWFSL